MAHIRIFKLFDMGINSPTSESCYYGRPSKRIWHVAAKSVRQAYFLAARNVWRKGGTGTGIVEEVPDGSDLWTHDDGTETYFPRFGHGQRL